jgi:flagellar biosynthetic protein FlhB
VALSGARVADPENKSHAPTAHRLADARRGGQLAVSPDLGHAVVFTAVVLALTMGGRAAFGRFFVYFKATLATAASSDSGVATIAAAGTRASQALLQVVGPVLVLAFVAAAAIGGLQTGGAFSPARLRLDASQLVPRWGRVFGPGVLAKVAKGYIKLCVGGAVAWLTLQLALPLLTRLAGAPPGTLVAVVAELGGRLGVRLALAMLAVGAADYLWQRRQHQRSLRMTADEVKRENKERQGDPLQKAQRQSLHRELAQQRLEADVRAAAFVVVAEERAVAISYVRGQGTAPTVTARGQRFSAERIKALAREAGIPLLGALALGPAFCDVREGDEIPPALYEAAAEILRVVYADGPRRMG